MQDRGLLSPTDRSAKKGENWQENFWMLRLARNPTPKKFVFFRAFGG
jgi:hypothetical protein